MAASLDHAEMLRQGLPIRPAKTALVRTVLQSPSAFPLLHGLIPYCRLPTRSRARSCALFSPPTFNPYPCRRPLEVPGYVPPTYYNCFAACLIHRTAPLHVLGVITDQFVACLVKASFFFRCSFAGGTLALPVSFERLIVSS